MTLAPFLAYLQSGSADEGAEHAFSGVDTKASWIQRDFERYTTPCARFPTW